MNNPETHKFHRDLWFKKETPLQVCDALALAYARQLRVRIWLGDPVTGVAWTDEHDVVGTIGRSTGQRKVPLLINRTNSCGGGAVLDHCIVRIDRTDGGGTVYKHPKFTNPADTWRVTGTADWQHLELPAFSVVDQAGSAQARFDKETTALRWLAFMRGERYNK